MKKVQNARSHEKALDELFKRYEERGAAYCQSSEYSDQNAREIEMRVNVQKTSKPEREYVPNASAELDTSVILQGIDRARYTKKENMNKNNTKNDIKAKLRAEADRANPKVEKNSSSQKDASQSDKSGKAHSKIKETAKVVAKTWIPLDERNEEKIVEGSKSNIPVSLIVAIMVITVSLLMIVGSAVLLGSAKNEQNELEEKIALLDSEIYELQGELDKKNAEAEIEIFAKEELGMISQEHVNFKYINSNKTDELTKTEAERVSLGSLIKWIFQQFK